MWEFDGQNWTMNPDPSTWREVNPVPTPDPNGASLLPTPDSNVNPQDIYQPVQ